MRDQKRYDIAVSAMLRVHAQDPRRESDDTGEHALELLYTRRLVAWVERLDPEASEALLLAASGFHGLFRNATQTLLVAVTGDITPPSETGRVSSLLTSSFSLGMVVGTLVAGAFFEISELTPFVIAAVVVLAAIAGLYRIPMRAAEVGKAV